MDRSRSLVGAGSARWLLAIPAVFFGLFFAYPLVRVVLRSLTLDGGLDLSPFVEIATKGSLRRAAWFTVWQATISTLATLLFALPGAYVVARYRFAARRLVRAAVTVPFVLPTVVVGTAFLVLLGPSGPLGVDLRQTVWAILAAHVFFNYAVVVRVVGSFWELIDPKLEEAARMLGATKARTFATVTLPLLLPSIAAAASIVFLFTFTSFGVVLILGGFGYATIEVAVWREATINLDLAASAALAVVQLVGIAAVLSVYSRLQQRHARRLPLRPAGGVARRPSTPGERLVVAGALASMVLYLGAPIVTLVARSLSTSSGLGLSHYTGLFQSGAGPVAPTEAILNSVWFAAAAMVPSLVVGLAAAVVISRRSGRAGARLDTLLMLPLGTSAVTVGFGFLVAFGWPVDLRTSAWLIPLAHSVVAVPFVIRTVTPVLRSVQPRLLEAASILGASPRRVFQEIELPIIRRAALVGAGFAAAVSLGEFGATAFLIRPDRPTIPTAIFRLLGQPGAATLGQAMALSVILMILTTLIIMTVERQRMEGAGDF
ncbi:MAG: iron ABC transporter permease [Acidimicrobiia bacterium]|nr:iron ABC transporter permease [Acidimicrobiia bacterium]